MGFIGGEGLNGPRIDKSNGFDFTSARAANNWRTSVNLEAFSRNIGSGAGWPLVKVIWLACSKLELAGDGMK